MTTTRQRQKGFSLMELLIALMIIGVIATMGLRGLRRNADQARYIAGQGKLREMAHSLDSYYLQAGKYPDFASWEQMIDANSPLVKGNMMQVNFPKDDGWGQPFEGKATKGTYELKFAGDPNDQETRPACVWEPGKGLVVLGGAAAGDKAAAPAAGAAK